MSHFFLSSSFCVSLRVSISLSLSLYRGISVSFFSLPSFHLALFLLWVCLCVCLLNACRVFLSRLFVGCPRHARDHEASRCEERPNCYSAHDVSSQPRPTLGASLLSRLLLFLSSSFLPLLFFFFLFVEQISTNG